MCGIYLACSPTSPKRPSSATEGRLKRRGPDSLRTIQLGPHPLRAEESSAPCHLIATSSVLTLRNGGTVRQPVQDISGQSASFLMWNGEIWNYSGEILLSHDTNFIFRQLILATKLEVIADRDDYSSSADTIQNVVNVFSKASGPYAFVFYDSIHQLLFYGRDVLGRRSLLIRKSAAFLELASVCGEGDTADFVEVEANGICVLDLRMSTNPDIEGSQRLLTFSEPMVIPWQMEDNMPACPYKLVCDLIFPLGDLTYKCNSHLRFPLLIELTAPKMIL